MSAYNSDAPIMPTASSDERAYRARSSLLRLLAAAFSGPMAAFAVPAVADTHTPRAASAPSVFRSPAVGRAIWRGRR
jgi:hypothetical protein